MAPPHMTAKTTNRNYILMKPTQKKDQCTRKSAEQRAWGVSYTMKENISSPKRNPWASKQDGLLIQGKRKVRTASSPATTLTLTVLTGIKHNWQLPSDHTVVTCRGSQHCAPSPTHTTALSSSETKNNCCPAPEGRSHGILPPLRLCDQSHPWWPKIPTTRESMP